MTYNDTVYAWLGSLGYTGTFNDRLYAWLLVYLDLAGSPKHYVLNDLIKLLVIQEGLTDVNAFFPWLLERTQGPQSPVELFGDDDLGGIWGPLPYFLDTAGTSEATYGEPVAGLPDALSESVDWQQPTSTARPILGRVPRTGARNQLDSTSDLSGAAWTKANITLGSPEANGAVKLVVDAGVTSGITRLYQGMPARSGVHTVQISAKAGELRYLNLAAFSGNSGNYSIASFDLVDGVVIGSRVSGVNYSAPETPASIKPDPDNDGYYICSFGVVIGSTAVSPSISIVGDSSPKTEPRYDETFFQYNSDGTSGIYVMKPQLEFADGATDYQRVGNEYDVTEAGVPSEYYLAFDGTDDFIDNTQTTYPAGTYTVALAGKNGTWIDTFEWEGGNFQVGVDTYTNGPAGIIPILGDLLVEGCFLINRAITQSEREFLINYYAKRGSAGLIELGDQLWSTTVVNQEWTDLGDGVYQKVPGSSYRVSSQTGAAATGRLYLCEHSLDIIEGGGTRMTAKGSSRSYDTTPGRHRELLVAGTGPDDFTVQPAANFSGTVSDISARELILP